MAAVNVSSGRASPLGASLTYATPSHSPSCASVNFAVHAGVEKTVYLCLFPPIGDSPIVTRDLLCPPIPLLARTGHVRHLEVRGLDPECAYALWVEGGARLHLDICARWVESRSVGYWGAYEGESLESAAGASQSMPDGIRSAAARVESFLQGFPLLQSLGIKFPFSLGRIVAPKLAREFDWGPKEAARTPIPADSLVIYEAQARGLSRALLPEQIAPALPGTFFAAAKRLDYLKSLGVNVVELLPIAEFNELERDHLDELGQLRPCFDTPHARKLNVWGYAPVQPAAFAPMGRYGATPMSSAVELKYFVQQTHLRGMECFLDVVYNHVSGASCSLHFLGVDKDYFILDKSGMHRNISGCGNTLSPNSVSVCQLVLESLRWWVTEYHVDGFRIDAAGVLVRDCNGNVSLDRTTILDMIAVCPILSTVKFVVEPWDAGDAVRSPNFLIGSYPLRSSLEWFPDFGRAVRWFLLHGDEAGSRHQRAKAFCKAMRGQKAFFKGRPFGAAHGVNYLSCHDGFALFDSVAYARKVNEDGYEEPSNCNHGAEGATSDESICALRDRQMRNLTLALVLARGTPMLSQGCEDGRTKDGNSNCYDADDMRNWLERDAGSTTLARFTRRALQLRAQHPSLRGPDFYDNLRWVNLSGEERASSSHRPNRSSADACKRAECKPFVAWTVAKDLYIAFNASAQTEVACLPSSCEGIEGCREEWYLLCDTGITDATNFPEHPPLIVRNEVKLGPNSACIAERREVAN